MKTEKLRIKESTLYLWLGVLLLVPGLVLAIQGDVLRVTLVLAGVAVMVALSAHVRITEVMAPTLALKKINGEAQAKADELAQARREWRER